MILTEQEIYDRYTERVAIMQFEGGLSHERASQTVFNLVAKWCKDHRLTFPQSIREDYRRVITGKKS